jgi:hypothetical protein
MNNSMTKILHQKISYEIIGAAMNVHSELGPGWDEEIYHQALLQALNQRGIKAESKLRGILKITDSDTAQKPINAYSPQSVSHKEFHTVSL